MEKEGRNPDPEEPTPVDQYAEQIQQKTPDVPGGDVFVAHGEDIQPKIPDQTDDPSGRLAAMIRTIIGEEEDDPFAEGSLLYDELLPYLMEFPSLLQDENTLAQACDLLRTPVEVPNWVYETGISDAIGSVAAKLRDEQLRALLERGIAPMDPPAGGRGSQ